ncbi:MAG: hydroxymethylbilane synthase [Verrucomicrobiales bacterium]|nr:hydroxymethylbilane synthase [Verrucomicrobiales bacterium]
MTVSKPLIIATRGSALALVQANAVLAQCRAAFPDRSFEIRIFKTTGDKLQTASLANTELPKGLFTKELEVALLNGEADLAVHSLKDLPTSLPEGLKLGAAGRREDARDVLLYRSGQGTLHRGFPPGLTVAGLPKGATVATSSTRRAAQLQELRPDLQVVPIRGNVGTRLRKLLEQEDVDATLLAAAGLRRLGFTQDASDCLSGGPADKEPVPAGQVRASYLAVDEMIPCVGQAAIGIEVREGDALLDPVCAALTHVDTEVCVTAERAFLNAMGGGCQAAVAALAEIGAGGLEMRVVSYLNGQPRRARGMGSKEDPAALGRRLAAEVSS